MNETLHTFILKQALFQLWICLPTNEQATYFQKDRAGRGWSLQLQKEEIMKKKASAQRKSKIQQENYY